jgi:hypothetical protein
MRGNLTSNSVQLAIYGRSLAISKLGKGEYERAIMRAPHDAHSRTMKYLCFQQMRSVQGKVSYSHAYGRRVRG